MVTPVFPARREAVPAAVAALILLVMAPSAAAADWSAAGGNLFVGSGQPDRPPQEAPLAEVAFAPQLPGPRQPFAAAVAESAARHGLDPKLLHALVAVESGYRVRAVSAAGAAGLTQLMPGTARDVGVADRFDPEANLAGGAAYLARQLLRFGDLRLALAAYNAGPDRIARLGRVPAIPETRQYVARVIDCYLALAAGRSVAGVGDCPGAEGGS